SAPADLGGIRARGLAGLSESCENHGCRIHMKNESRLTRRLFAAGIAGSATPLAQQPAASPAPPAAGAAQIPPTPGRRPQPVEPLPFAETLVFTRKDAELRTTAYPMSQVRLLDGPCKQAADYNRAYMMRTAPDRLLHTFRLNAGLASSAQPLGGWEAPGGELRGHTTGHYLSACALRAASADTEVKSRGDEIVAELAKCQAKQSGGYLSAYPTEFYDRLGAVLYLPQDPGGRARHVLPRRQQTGARSRQRHGCLGGRVERFQARSPH